MERRRRAADNAQARSSGPAIVGIKTSWCAVIHQGVLDAAYSGAREPQRMIADGARRWLSSDSISPPSFRWACDVLGLDAGRIVKEVALTQKWEPQFYKRPSNAMDDSSSVPIPGLRNAHQG